MLNKEKINVFEPFTTGESMESISQFCNYNNINWNNLLEMSTSGILNVFLSSNSIEDQIQFSNCLDHVEKVTNHLDEKVGTIQLKLRGAAYLLKAMTETMNSTGYNSPFQLTPQLYIDYFSPITDSNTVERFNHLCAENSITALEVLDTGLCWYGVDTVLGDYSELTGMGLMDIDRIGSGAVVAKMINGYLRYLETTPYDRIITLLIMTKAFAASTLGVCPKTLREGH